GNQDLVAICLRLALIHAMYQNEKPFIIIDDSFVNLDDEKVELAKKFLTTIAQEYQVIYFTCHDSRA
ncbi:MAG TPA: AAA family ATPase, partial [Lachnospiraceae bacterium]|nr:AAA family ATPase [Lachnospiraceae bacterium]